MRRLASVLAIALVAWPHATAGSPQYQENPQPPKNLENPQNLEGAAPAHVAYVEGTVSLERDGRPETAPLNMPLLSGDRLKTMDGRAEVLFGDGSALHLDARTTIDLQSDDLLRLIDGRLRLQIAGLADGTAARSARIVYRVDSPAGSVRITQPGEYRVAMLRRGEEAQLELAVLRGAGEIFTDEGTTAVRAGERAYASAGLAPSYAYAYNSANWDAFDRWSESRRDARLGVSAQYLPSEVRAYSSTFDEDGDWRYSQPYGYVWYPRVDVSWRPYYYGRWARYPHFGWTWIGADRFAWATHHYGRWGFSAGAWFWIPAHRWAPAYVSWAYAPGYVSWCPLGFDNRPVLAINIFNVGAGYYSSRRAWTAVGYSHFGRDYVHRRAVDWDRFDRGRRPSFQIAQAGPAVRDIAVPRRSATAQGAASPVEGRSTPIRWAGSRTSARVTSPEPSAAPRYINRGDEIVRSRTGRPSAAPQGTRDLDTAVPRPSVGTSSVPSRPEDRTMPTGPARRIDPSERPSIAAPDAPVYRSPMGAYPGYERRAVPRPSTGAQGVPGNAEGRAAPPDARAPYRGSAGPAAPDPGDRGYARPRGGYESRPAPAAGSAGDRQSPPPRAMPDRSAPSRETAVPRGGGSAAPRDAGPRAAPPAGAPSGARSRGRGGV